MAAAMIVIPVVIMVAMMPMVMVPVPNSYRDDDIR